MPLPKNPLLLALLALVLLGGIFLRVPRAADREEAGFDENVYRRYVTVLGDGGVLAFPELSRAYLESQRDKNAFLPPTRVLFLTSAFVWGSVTGADALESVRMASFLAACGVLLLGAAWAWRLGGIEMALGVAALLACAPLQIHLAHRALIDGFFAFWALLALWSLWEALRAPERREWRWLYGLALAAMVLTKENAFFVFVAICGLLLANRWAHFGRATLPLYITTFAAPAVGALLLVAAAGGPSTLLAMYRLNIAKSMVLPYAIETGDGPWFRYLVDLMLMQPALLIVALMAAGKWSRREPARIFFVLFLALTFAVMSRVRYGMNLRYGAMWDLPLCILAFSQLTDWCAALPERRRVLALSASVALIAGLGLHQFQHLFRDVKIYDPTPAAMGSALQILKQ